MKPEKQKQELRKRISEIYEKKEEKAKVDSFLSLLNTEPPEGKVKQIPVGKNRQGKTVNADYLPIEHVQMLLDEIFGSWDEENMTFQQVFNEVVVTLTLVVQSPANGEIIRRQGIGAAPIAAKQSSSMEYFVANKMKNGVQSAAPAAKAFALKNAAASLGKMFGRDLNREDARQFHEISQYLQ